MNACTRVLTDSVSHDRRTRLSWRSQKKHVAQIMETCLSRLRSDEIVTPRTRTWSLGTTVSAPRCSDGTLQPSEVCPCREPTQSSSVFSAFNLCRLADIQRLTSGTVQVAQQWIECHCDDNADIVACHQRIYVGLQSTSCFLSSAARSAVYKMKRHGPTTEPCGTEHMM